MKNTIRTYRDAFFRFIGKGVLLVMCTMALVAAAAWQEPGGPDLPANTIIEDYKPEHVLSAHQHKNYTILPDFTLSIGNQAPLAIADVGLGNENPIGLGAAFSPFLALVVGNFQTGVIAGYKYNFPEATYAEGIQKESGNIVAESREDTAGGTAVVVPGVISADISSYGGNNAYSRNVLHLDGADDTALAANAPENDMVNILLQDDVSISSPFIRFGLEKSTAPAGFASLRMGTVAVDRAFVGGVVESLVNQPAILNNFVGNFNYGPDPFYIGKPFVLQGALSSGAKTTPTSTFSNIGYGDYCYIQNPAKGVICPDGFFLSKYDGQNEAICRSFNPAQGAPASIDVPNDFRKDINNSNHVSNFVNSAISDCKSTKPTYICSDYLDNDGDGSTDYPADPGCDSAEDMSEKNPPIIPPPGPNPYVTAMLKGPYPGKACNVNLPVPGGLIDADKTDWITFIDDAKSPYLTPSVTSGYPPTPAELAWADNPSYLFNEVPNIQYVSSADKIPQKGDTIVSNGHYGYNTIFGAYTRKGPVVPGWYFIVNQVNPPYTNPLYKIKLGWGGHFILDVKSC